MDDGLWEREAELAALNAVLSDAGLATAGRLLVIEGPAGVGKSRLLLAARREAAKRGLPVLTARGMELERGVPFGLARQLFAQHLVQASDEERTRLLAGPAALASPLLADATDTDALMGEGQAGALVQGLYWLAVNLGRSGTGQSGAPGLVLIVDDAQWADRSSLRFLVHAVGQLEEIALCVLVGIRTGEPNTPTDLIGRLTAHPGAIRLRPAPLTLPAVSQFVRERGFPEAADEFCLACAHVSGGNPFLLGELLTVLLADGIESDARAAGRVSQLLPDSVLNAVVINLGRLPDTAAQLAGAVAVLDEAPLPLAAALAGLEIEVAEDAADALAAAHLLAPGEPLTFVHPLIAAAVLADLPPLGRARAHRQAAQLLDAAGADVGRIAVHLLDTRPQGDAWAAAQLLAAGRDALLHAEPRSAIRFLQRSLNEPPADDQRATTLIALAQAEAADDSPHAVARLVDALESVRGPRQRADAYNQLARLLFFKGDIGQAAEAAERGLAELDPADPMASQLISAQLTAATFDTNLRPGVTDRLAPYLAEARAGHPPRDPMICAHLGARMAISGDPAEVVLPVIEGAFAQHPMVDESAHGVVLAFPLVSLLMIDEIERAEAALQRALSSSRARSSLITLTVAHHWWAVVSYRRGELVDALAHDQRALAACGTDDWDLYGAWIGANLAHIWLERGDIEAAAAALGGDADDAVDPIGGCLQLEARGRLALARGQGQSAYEHFCDAGQKLDAMGMVSPGFVAWRSSVALAAHQMGREQGANALVEQELTLARRTGSARAIGIALRAAALFATGDRRLTLLTESCETLHRSASRLEHAKSLAELGAALRRDGQRTAAGQPLRKALDIATRSGAEPLAERIRNELSAAGSRPRRAALTGIDALTPTERRIAQLAAEHRTNAQIAHDLYVTSKTVEWHLGNVFRKLEVTSRTQLNTIL
jgi:DNA-binding CsgD family transcriptional regulator